jgi:hypothetical protein
MQLTLLGSTIKKIVGYGANLYHFTEAGVDVHRQSDGERLAWAALANFTCGAVNDNGVYLGTSAAGVYLLPHAAVTTGGDQAGALVQKFTASSVPPLGSSVVNRMAGRGPGLLVTTAAGATWLPDSAETRVVDPGTLRPTWRRHVDAGGCGAAAINAASNGLAVAINGGAGGVALVAPAAGMSSASRSAMGASLSDASKWIGAIMAPNGKIYGIPFDAADILIIDPAAGTASRSAMGATLTGTGKWYRGALAPNGKVYGIPDGAADILIIDPVAGTASRSTMGASLSDASKWRDGVLATNGKIYGIPQNAADILIIDPAAGTASRSDMGATLTGTGKWMAGALAPDGKIYGTAFAATDLLIISPPAPAVVASPDILSDTIRDIAYGADLFIATDAGISIWDGAAVTNITAPLGAVLDVQSIHPASTATKNSGLLAYGTSDGLDGGRFGVLDLAEV